MVNFDKNDLRSIGHIFGSYIDKLQRQDIQDESDDYFQEIFDYSIAGK